MGFESPGSWGWAILSVVVAALYLWRFPYRAREVATFALWQRALARRPAWFALRFWLSLSAQIALVLLIVAALAQPFWKQTAANRRWIVLVLDVSASMSATDVLPSRFEAMRDQARQIIQNLQRGEQMAILSAGTVIRPVARFGASRDSLLDAVDALQPTDGPATAPEAVALAQDLLRGRPNAHIVVVTDGTFPDASAVGNLEGVRLVLIGGEGDNAAITHFATRRHSDDSSRWDMAIHAANRGGEPVPGQLQITLGGTDVQTVPVGIEPGQGFLHPMTVSAPEGGFLKAELRVDDHLDADNRAQWRLPRPAEARVQLIAAESDVSAALQHALQAMTDIPWETAPQFPDHFDPQTIHIVHRQVPAEIPTGHWLLLDPESGSDLWEHDGTLAGADCQVARVDASSALLTGVDLQGVVFERLSRLTFRLPARSLATAASGDAVYSVLERPEGTVLVFQAAPGREYSDFVLRPEFARLVQLAVRWLAAVDHPGIAIEQPLAGRPAAVWAGDALRRAAGLKTADVVHLAEGQTIGRLDESGRMIESFPGPLVALDRAGSWAWKDGRPAAEQPSTREDQVLVPVNLLDAAGSTLVRAEAVQADEPPLADTGWDQPLWMLLAGLVILLLAVEWSFYHRRMVV